MTPDETTTTTNTTTTTTPTLTSLTALQQNYAKLCAELGEKYYQKRVVGEEIDALTIKISKLHSEAKAMEATTTTEQATA